MIQATVFLISYSCFYLFSAYLQSNKLWSTLQCFKADIDWAAIEDMCKNGEGSSNCYTDKEYVPETSDSTRTKNAKGEKVTSTMSVTPEIILV